MKKTKKIRPYNVEGVYVLSKDKKLLHGRSDGAIVEVTMEDLERIYLYSKQRKNQLKKHFKNKQLRIFVVRLSEDVQFIVDNRSKK